MMHKLPRNVLSSHSCVESFLGFLVTVYAILQHPNHVMLQAKLRCAHVSQLIMNIPFTAIHFATYESCKKLLAMQEDESLAVQLAAGGTAGGVSAALTTPLDVVKTRLQLEGVNSATRYQSTAVVRCPEIMHFICQDMASTGAMWVKHHEVMHSMLSRHGQYKCCVGKTL